MIAVALAVAVYAVAGGAAIILAAFTPRTWLMGFYLVVAVACWMKVLLVIDNSPTEGPRSEHADE